MIAFYIILFIVLLLIAIIDYSISEIPNALNGMLGILGIVYYFINLNASWWLPLVLAVGSFLLFFGFFLLTGELAIGGGDMKMIIITMLFINSWMALYYYLIWFSVFALIGIIITYAKKEKGVRCGPYLGLALIFTLIAHTLSFKQEIAITEIFMIGTISNSYLFLSLRGEWPFDEKDYSIF